MKLLAGSITASGNLILNTAVSGVSACSISTGIYYPEYGAIITVGLILLLSLKEVLSASSQWSRDLNGSLNTAILPLLVSFFGIVVFKVLAILA
ncbi:MAG: hypothetical protein AB3K77_11505 [Methanosarcinaceae archaeon]|uniref:hypothetical protein n=1 Tax=Methanosarcina sp. MTP4 TaxID=1434100 RepID=UPI001E40DE13|nr:hypothetical protein [Methanosarcina sp. MTP4]